jgi:hypothetical protein
MEPVQELPVQVQLTQALERQVINNSLSLNISLIALKAMKYSVTSSLFYCNNHQLNSSMRKLVIAAQGFYYLLTGLWPILHMESFMAVTGPKTDQWLVRMVALLTIVISIELLAGIKYGQASQRLSIGAALSYLIIDSYYSLNGTISRVYLVDAAVQLLFIVLLVVAGRKSLADMQ